MIGSILSLLSIVLFAITFLFAFGYLLHFRENRIRKESKPWDEQSKEDLKRLRVENRIKELKVAAIELEAKKAYYIAQEKIYKQVDLQGLSRQEIVRHGFTSFGDRLCPACQIVCSHTTVGAEEGKPGTDENTEQQ